MSRQAQKRRARQEKTQGQLHRRGLLGPDDGTTVVPPRATSVAIQDLLTDLETEKATLRVLFHARRTYGIGSEMPVRATKRRRDGNYPESIAHVSARMREIKAKIARLSSS